MHPFPPLERLGFLLGNELNSVNVGPYQIDVRFVEGVHLCVEFGLEYVDAEGRVHRHDPQQRSGPDPIVFHHLIGDLVAAVEREDFRMTLVFDSGRKLVVLSEAGPYESGHIGHSEYDENGLLKGQDLIVF